MHPITVNFRVKLTASPDWKGGAWRDAGGWIRPVEGMDKQRAHAPLLLGEPVECEGETVAQRPGLYLDRNMEQAIVNRKRRLLTCYTLFALDADGAVQILATESDENTVALLPHVETYLATRAAMPYDGE